MKTLPKLSRIYFQIGIVLLEGLIAILIFSIGILGVIALQANMTKAASEAKYRAEAGFVVQQRIAAIWQVSLADQANQSEPDPGTDISPTSTVVANRTGLPSGRRMTTRGGAACNNESTCFIVTVSWLEPGSNVTHNVTTVAHIAGVF